LWAVLDCPGSFTFPQPAGEAIVLGEFQAQLFGEVSAGERCVLVAWQVASQGRKHHTATALFGDSGSCRALGFATFLTVPERQGAVFPIYCHEDVRSYMGKIPSGPTDAPPTLGGVRREGSARCDLRPGSRWKPSSCRRRENSTTMCAEAVEWIAMVG
jgi:hypothetical protein